MPYPLHPAVVHFPIVLSFLVPAFAVWAFVRDGRKPPGHSPVWPVVVVLCAALVATSYLAINTGGRQVDKVKRVVPQKAIHAHEEAADRVMIGAILCLAGALGGLMAGRTGRVARGVTVGLSLLMISAVGRTAQLGGALVYEDGAASAYTSGACDSPRTEKPPAEDHDGRAPS